MNCTKNIIEYLIITGLEWIYATRNKKKFYKSISWIIFLMLFMMGISMALFLGESIVFYSLPDRRIKSLLRIFCIVFCVVSIIVLNNYGQEHCQYSRILLSYYYLKRINKRSRFSWNKLTGTIVLCVVLIVMLSKEIGYIFQSEKNNFSTNEILVVCLVVIALIVYLSLTEGIIDKVYYYKMQARASITLFFLMLYVYIESLSSVSENDSNIIWGIMLFAIGQIAFATSALSSYKKMYLVLKDRRKEELERYLQEVDNGYDEKIKELNKGINEIKYIGNICKKIWEDMNWKQRIIIIATILTPTIGYIGLIVITARHVK